MNLRFQELSPHGYQLSIYNRIRSNWANERMGYGDIVYLETGTGKTYIAIMLLKYLFSEHYIDYKTRYSQELHNLQDGEAVQFLKRIQLPDETEEQVILRPYSEEV